MWSKAGQPTIDGVIAVNSRVAEKLLAVTGPIELPEYGKTITAENFMLETQSPSSLSTTRRERAKEDHQRAVRGDAEESSRLCRVKDMAKVLALIAESVETKDVQISFRRPEEGRLPRSMDGAAGYPRLRPTAWPSSRATSPGRRRTASSPRIPKQTVRVHHRRHDRCDGRAPPYA